MKLTEVIRRPLVTEKTTTLREDGNRLFMIVRVGDPKPDKPDDPVVGVDRIYDRVRVPSPSK